MNSSIDRAFDHLIPEVGGVAVLLTMDLESEQEVYFEAQCR